MNNIYDDDKINHNGYGYSGCYRKDDTVRICIIISLECRESSVRFRFVVN